MRLFVRLAVFIRWATTGNDGCHTMDTGCGDGSALSAASSLVTPPPSSGDRAGRDDKKKRRERAQIIPQGQYPVIAEEPTTRFFNHIT